MANLQNLTPWKPGQSGNLNGRPVGSRTVFSQAFLKDLAEVWSDEGCEAMLKTSLPKATQFELLRDVACRSLPPKTALVARD